MLAEILKRLTLGESCSQDDLARICGTSRETAEAAIAYLAHAGYLKRVPLGQGCGGSCAGCSGCSVDSGRKNPVLWERVR